MPKAGRVRHAKINCSCRDERFELDISKARESSEKDTAGQRPAFESNKRMEEQRKLAGLKEHISNEEWKRGRKIA